MWNGAIYGKSLDYLLRILLRLHLAPSRESRFKTTVRAAAQRKQNRVNALRNRSATQHTNHVMPKKLWGTKLRKLCDELSDVLQTSLAGQGNPRILRIAGQLSALTAQTPAGGMPNPIPPLAQQLTVAQAAAAQAAAAQPGAATQQGTTAQVVSDVTFLDNADIDIDADVVDEIEGEEEEEEEADGGNGGATGDGGGAAAGAGGGSGDGQGTNVGKEPTRARLRALQAVLKILIESPAIQNGVVTKNWVKRTAFNGEDFTDKELGVVAYLATVLRPYAPKKWQNQDDGDGSRYRDHTAHVTLRAPIVLIANAVLRATGYSRFARRVSPQPTVSSVHALHLGPAGIYEVLCQADAGHFDIVDAAGNPLTIIANVTSPRANIRAAFKAFFDMDKVEGICKAHGLRFADRYVPPNRLQSICLRKVLSRYIHW